MATWLKIILIALVLFLGIVSLDLWFSTFIVGQYYMHAGIGLQILGFLAPVAVLGIAIMATTMLVKLKA